MSAQRDIRELQFAKAAIATGWRVLLEEAGLQAGDVQQVLLAGSFGSYLSPANAIRIGLVPKLPAARVVSAGNVAGERAAGDDGKTLTTLRAGTNSPEPAAVRPGTAAGRRTRR